MKKSLVLLVSSLGSFCAAHGAFVVTFGGGSIPDVGSRAFVGSVSTATGFISSLTVSLSITGENKDHPAYNGDLYVTLQHGPGFTVLLNRPGKALGNPYGYGDNGMDVTFDDSGSALDVHTDVHTYQLTLKPPANGQLTGTWLSDGRAADPKDVLDTTPRTKFLSSFLGAVPNGDWWLFVADLSAGGNAKLLSWSLNIETTPIPVPEPAWAMALTAVGLGGFVWLRRGRRSA